MGTRRLLVRIITEYVDKGVKESKKDVESLTDKITKNLGNIAAGAAVAAGAAIVKFAQDSMAAFSQFDKGIREVFTLMPGMTSEAMDKMSQDVLNFSVATGQSATDSVAALYQALSAGVPADNVFEFLETANAAALGGVTTLETAVDGITSVVNAYGKEVIDAGTASDVMFQAVKLGKTNFEQLSTSLFNVVPTAASLGVSFEDVAANLAALTAQGTPTSVATTQLRQAFIEASKSGTALDAAIKQLTGQSFSGLIASGMTSSEIFTALRDSMPEQEFRDLFGSVEASNAVLGLTNDTAANIISTFGGLEGALGSTTEAAALMADSMANLESRAAAASEAYKIAKAESINPIKQAYLEWKIEMLESATANERVASASNATRDAFEKLGFSSGEANRALVALTDAGITASGSLQDADAIARRTAIAQQLLADGFQGTAKELGEQARLIDQTEGGMRAYNAAAGEFYAAQAEAAEGTGIVTGALENQTPVLRLNEQLMRDVNRTILEFNQANGNTKPLAAATTRELEEMAYATGDLGDYEQAMLAPIKANNEALEEQEEAAKLAAEAHRELESRMGSYFTTALEAGESTETVEEMLYREAQAAGAPAEALAILAAMTGNFTDEQIEAALRTAAMSEKAREMGQAIADGSISIQQARAELVTFQAQLDNPLEPQFNTESIDAGIQQTAALVAEMKNIPLNVATSILMNGLDESKRGIGELINLINQVDGRSASASVTVNTSAPGDLGSGSSGGAKPPGKALGGPVNEGQPYIIGERGPELFVPNTSGTVVPNGGYGGFTDNSQTNIHNYNQQAAAITATLVQQQRRRKFDAYMGVG